MIRLSKAFNGTILDIGGGGEGVIGQLYGRQVVAIDNRREELEEAPDCCPKILMDATEMTFSDASFDHITSFYTLMFMTADEQQKTLREAFRVLKPNGEVHIWDCDIACAYPEPFVVDVEVQLPDRRIKTNYGVGKMDAQSADSIHSICKSAGFVVETTELDAPHFYIRCRKPE